MEAHGAGQRDNTVALFGAMASVKEGLQSILGKSAVLALEWPCNSVVASVQIERRLLSVLHRKGESGRGMDLPDARQEEIKAFAAKCGATTYQALSLRRTLLRSFPSGNQRFGQSPKMGHNAMGTDAGQQNCAGLFELAIEKFLTEAGAKFKEKMQQDEVRKGRPPTPDFLFPEEPIRVNGKLVHWIDAKNFYGSAHFTDNERLPIGKARAHAAKYVQAFGPGALVFAQVPFIPPLGPAARKSVRFGAAPVRLSVFARYFRTHHGRRARTW